jgi:hypothetical protein
MMVTGFGALNKKDMFTEYNTGILRASNASEQEYLDEQMDAMQEAEDRARLEEAQNKVWELRINYEYPPIPLRQFDWSCTIKDYDLGAIIAYGSTIQEAIENFLEAVADKVDHVDFNREDVNYTWS